MEVSIKMQKQRLARLMGHLSVRRNGFVCQKKEQNHYFNNSRKQSSFLVKMNPTLLSTKAMYLSHLSNTRNVMGIVKSPTRVV